METDGDSHFSLSRKSHVRYPTRYPQLRNAEETAEYQQNAGIPLAPPIIEGHSVRGGSFCWNDAVSRTCLPNLKKRFTVIETGYKVV